MKKKAHSEDKTAVYLANYSKPAMLTMAIVAIFLGLIFIFTMGDNKPIERGEAVAYSGEFESYEVWKNYCEIHFADGSVYDVYPHTESSDFRERMESLPKGTKLSVLVNPNNWYVVEIKTESEELLNFEQSQQAIDDYDNGYVVLGIAVCAMGVFLIGYVIGSTLSKRKEQARQSEQALYNGEKGDTLPLRYADPSVKHRVLLEANTEGYRICYRRVKSVNELVINGRVYDEMKALIEFEHNLSAVVDGHRIDAGYDENACSYILFDRQTVAKKLRLI